MRFTASIAIFALLATVTQAQTQDEIQTVMDSWSAGTLQTMYGAFLNAESGEWYNAPGTRKWDVERVEASTLRLVGEAGDEGPAFDFHVELGDGIYSVFQVGENGERLDERRMPIVAATVNGPNDWILTVRTSDGDEGGLVRFMQLYVAGGLFVRTDFVSPNGSDVRKRIGLAVHKRISE